MPDSAYSLYDFFQSSRRRCDSVREWICKPISSVLQSIVTSPIGHSLPKLILEESRHNFLLPHMDVIEISSSESDSDIETGDSEEWNTIGNDVDTNSCSTFENPTHSSQLTLLAESNKERSPQQSQKRILPRSLQPTAIDKPYPGTKYYGGSYVSKPPVMYHRNEPDSKISMGDTSGSKREEFSNANNGRLRTLPSSIVGGKYIKDNQGKVPIETNGSGRDLDFQGKASNSLGENSAYRFPPFIKNGTLVTDTSPNMSTDKDLHMYGRTDTHTRTLPPSLMHNKFVRVTQQGGVNHANQSVIREERPFEHDERVIFEEALQNLNQTKLEDDLPEGLLAVSLLNHQKSALAWMVQKEKSVHCAGGILADDQGLGKTISIIALIQKQMVQQSKYVSDDLRSDTTEALNLDEDDDGILEVARTQTIKKAGVKIENDDVKIEKNCLNRKPMAGTSVNTTCNKKPAAGTLVVCPASILRQWAHELQEKVTDTARLSVLIYHGGGRTKDPIDLAKYDVVLTTYAIVTNEVPTRDAGNEDDVEHKNLDKYGLSSEFSTNNKRKQTSNGHMKAKKKGKKSKGSHFDIDRGPIASVRWFRVVLDEAQTIKNYRTKVAKACSGLRAKRRWCLSGTPIQNTVDDLFSYFRFLKYAPYSDYGSFCSSIKIPISRNAEKGYKKLQTILRIVLLRRTKDTLINGQPIVNLPPKSVCLKKMDFSAKEREFYVKLETHSREQFKEYDQAGTLKQNYANILLMLLRLRQACDHPFLVKGKISDTIQKDSLEMARQLPREMVINLLHQLNSLSICALCSDPPEDAVVTMCSHVFCYQCVSDRLTGDENQCPKAGCKEILGSDVVFGRAALESCIYDDVNKNTNASSSALVEDSPILQSGYISTKISAALEILSSICNQNLKVDTEAHDKVDSYPNKTLNLISEGPHSYDARGHTKDQLNLNPEVPIKAIVFSQWTTMLDLLEFSLNASLIQYRRLDGSMTLVSRDKAVKEFNNDPEVTVMLMSLKAGNLGLNMTAACHVIILDLWWNPFAEDQAVDRAHRIGQTRPVTVSRLTINDTVEDRILALQEDKKMMAASAFGEGQQGNNVTRLTVEDLRYLFGV